MKTRILHTRFWNDNFISELNAKEKLLFVYLLTNEKVNIIGVYELPDKYIKTDLDLTQSELDTCKKKLQSNNKIIFSKGWVKIVNVDKYNSYNGEKLDKARERELSEAPIELIEYKGGIDTSIDTSIDTLNNHKSLIINNNHINIRPKNKSYFLREMITPEQVDKIQQELHVAPESIQDMIDAMDAWSNGKGNTALNWYLTLRNWLNKGIQEGKIKQITNYSKADEQLIAISTRNMGIDKK